MISGYRPFPPSVLRFHTGYKSSSIQYSKKRSREWTEVAGNNPGHSRDISSLSPIPVTSGRPSGEKSCADGPVFSLPPLSSGTAECQEMVGPTLHVVPHGARAPGNFMICFKMVVITHFMFIWTLWIIAFGEGIKSFFFLLALEACKENVCMVLGSR